MSDPRESSKAPATYSLPSNQASERTWPAKLAITVCSPASSSQTSPWRSPNESPVASASTPPSPSASAEKPSPGGSMLQVSCTGDHSPSRNRTSGVTARSSWYAKRPVASTLPSESTAKSYTFGVMPSCPVNPEIVKRRSQTPGERASTLVAPQPLGAPAEPPPVPLAPLSPAPAPLSPPAAVAPSPPAPLSLPPAPLAPPAPLSPSVVPSPALPCSGGRVLSPSPQPAAGSPPSSPRKTRRSVFADRARMHQSYPATGRQLAQNRTLSLAPPHPIVQIC